MFALALCSLFLINIGDTAPVESMNEHLAEKSGMSYIFFIFMLLFYVG